MVGVGSPAWRRVLNWLPAMLAVTMIACESTATMSSTNTSRWLLPIWVHLFGPIAADRWAVVHHILRKTGHFLGYGTVSLCFFQGWRTSLSTQCRSLSAMWRLSAVLAVLCTLVIASADEYHQSFLPGRTAAVSDVGLDVCGAIVAQLLLLTLLLGVVRSRERKPVVV